MLDRLLRIVISTVIMSIFVAGDIAYGWLAYIVFGPEWDAVNRGFTIGLMVVAGILLCFGTWVLGIAYVGVLKDTINFGAIVAAITPNKPIQAPVQPSVIVPDRPLVPTQDYSVLPASRQKPDYTVTWILAGLVVVLTLVCLRLMRRIRKLKR